MKSWRTSTSVSGKWTESLISFFQTSRPRIAVPLWPLSCTERQAWLELLCLQSRRIWQKVAADQKNKLFWFGKARLTHFRPRHARAPVIYLLWNEDSQGEENIFLTSTKWQKSITGPIFEETSRVESMRVVPITSWKKGIFLFRLDIISTYGYSEPQEYEY